MPSKKESDATPSGTRKGGAIKVAASRTSTKTSVKSAVVAKPAVKKTVTAKPTGGTKQVSSASGTAKTVSATSRAAKAKPAASKAVKSVAGAVKAAAKTVKAAAKTTVKAAAKSVATASESSAVKAAKAKGAEVVKNAKAGVGKAAKSVAPKGVKTTAAKTKKSVSGNGSRKPEIVVPSEDNIQPPNPTDVKEKFFHEHRGGYVEPVYREIPYEYGDTKIVLLARDPEWIYAYWEVDDARREELNLPRNGHNYRMAIRMYKVTDRNWPDEAAHYFFDIDVSPYSNNWYLKVPEAGQHWCGELGMFDEQNNFIPIVRSNVICTPRDFVSQETDTEWMTVEETFRQLYGLSGGYTLQELRGSETLLRDIHRQKLPTLRGAEMSSGSVSSSAARPVRSAVKDFWLQVHTELILFGATEPDASVTVQGREVKLNADGTFSVRYSLPDGEQVLRVHATNRDGDMERVITPVVTKKTR